MLEARLQASGFARGRIFDERGQLGKEGEATAEENGAHFGVPDSNRLALSLRPGVRGDQGEQLRPQCDFVNDVKRVWIVIELGSGMKTHDAADEGTDKETGVSRSGTGARVKGWTYKVPTANTRATPNLRFNGMFRCQTAQRGNARIKKSDDTFQMPLSMKDRYTLAQRPGSHGFEIFARGMHAKIKPNKPPK